MEQAEAETQEDSQLGARPLPPPPRAPSVLEKQLGLGARFTRDLKACKWPQSHHFFLGPWLMSVQGGLGGQGSWCARAVWLCPAWTPSWLPVTEVPLNKTEAPCACLLCLELSQFEIEAYGNNNKASPGKVDSWDRNDWKLLHCHQPSVAIDRAPKMQLPWPAAGKTDLGAGAVPLPEGGQVTAGAPQRAPSLCSSEVTHWVTPLSKFL